MAGFFARGTMKPPLGAQVNPAHPFSYRLLLAVPFTEGCGAPSILSGPLSLDDEQPTGALAANTSPAPDWASNLEGPCGRFSTWNTRSWGVYRPFGANLGAWLPTEAVTVCLIRRKLNTTLHDGLAFAESNGATAAALRVFLPYSDGVVYWDFGGNSSPNRFTVSGLSFGTGMERWILTAGPRGHTIWRNGVKVGSQSTPVSRSASAADGKLDLNAGGDEQEFSLFQMSAHQWSDDLCRWWSAEPYAHLYTAQSRTYQFLGMGAGAGVTVRPTHYYAQQRQQAM